MPKNPVVQRQKSSNSYDYMEVLKRLKAWSFENNMLKGCEYYSKQAGNYEQ